MKAFHLICLYCLCCLYGRAQDTIFRVTGDPLLVRVLEISEKDVKYKNFYNPDGVIRVIGNPEISRIVYENGKEEPRFKANALASPNGAPGAYQPALFVLDGRHIAYKNEDITPKAAFKIMMLRDPQKNSDDLNNMLVRVQGNKTGQVAFIVLSPVCLLGGAYIARYNLYGPNDYAKARRTLLIGFGLCAGTFVTSMIYRSIKNKHIRQAAMLYNNEI